MNDITRALEGGLFIKKNANSFHCSEVLPWKMEHPLVCPQAFTLAPSLNFFCNFFFIRFAIHSFVKEYSRTAEIVYTLQHYLVTYLPELKIFTLYFMI